MRSNVLYTMGHSNQTVDEFVQVLQAYGIELLVDIGRFPTSKRKWLKPLRRSWRWGDSLGEHENGGYERYMQSDAYTVGMEKSCDLANKKTGSTMRAEGLAFKSHRRFVARTMTERGFQLIHILDEKSSFSLKPLT